MASLRPTSQLASGPEEGPLEMCRKYLTLPDCSVDCDGLLFVMAADSHGQIIIKIFNIIKHRDIMSMSY